MVPQHELQRALQDLRIEMSVLTNRVAAAAGLLSGDLDVLDVLVHEGPSTPGRLARRVGLAPATLTGVLARLEHDGWVRRTRDETDRRVAVLTPVAARVRQLGGLFARADASLGTAMRALRQEDRQRITAFLRQTCVLTRAAADTLAPPEQGLRRRSGLRSLSGRRRARR